MDYRVVTALLQLKHSTLRNYIIPGLDSSLLATAGEHGCIRLFECSRDHQENITPHSHRFGFTCLVLAGVVRNFIWERDSQGDDFIASTLTYGGQPGAYDITRDEEPSRWSRYDNYYKEGDVYQMSCEQVHSIYFTRGTRVLFIEGPSVCNQTRIIEPFVNGERIPSFRVEDWMFRRE
jgi:hypothetical protein